MYRLDGSNLLDDINSNKYYHLKERRLIITQITLFSSGVILCIIILLVRRMIQI
jgi:hypothetical protein